MLNPKESETTNLGTLYNSSNVIWGEYSYNIKSSNFPILTAGRRNRKTTNMEIIELGDSHGWGQGSSGNEWIEGQPTYSFHNPTPTSRGFYEILNEHIAHKFNFYDTMISCDGFPVAGELIKQDVNKKKVESIEKNKDLLEVLTGRIYSNPKLALQNVEDISFYNRIARNDVANLGYNNIRQKMPPSFFAFGKEGTAPFKLSIDMKHPARKMYMGVIKTIQSCKIKLYFDTKGIPSTTSGEYYKIPTGFPKIFRMVDGVEMECSSAEAIVSGGNISIDTYSATTKDVVYCIDWGFKQKGELFIEYNGYIDGSTDLPALASRAFYLRGIVFDRNSTLNYSMGGHTTGGWLGTEASYQDGAYDHIAEILRYSSFTPYLALIQAPIVNEYLRQTPIETFKSNLAILVNRLNNHRNSSKTKAMDVLFLTTIGGKIPEFNSDTATIKYDAYFTALKEFCDTNQYGMIDFRKLFKGKVSEGIIDYEMLYHDSNHPSSFVHEFIGKELINVVNSIF